MMLSNHPQVSGFTYQQQRLKLLFEPHLQLPKSNPSEATQNLYEHLCV